MKLTLTKTQIDAAQKVTDVSIGDVISIGGLQFEYSNSDYDASYSWICGDCDDLHLSLELDNAHHPPGKPWWVAYPSSPVWVRGFGTTPLEAFKAFLEDADEVALFYKREIIHIKEKRERLARTIRKTIKKYKRADEKQ